MKFPLKLHKKVHFSWHIAAVSAGVLFGVALSPFSQRFIGTQWLIITFSILAAVAIKRSLLMLILAFTAGMLFGLWRGSYEILQLSGYEQYYGQQVMVRGKVTDDTIRGINGDQRLRLKQVKINGSDLPGQVWISTSGAVDLKRGDIIDAEGLLGEGFGTMSGSIFRARLISAQRPEPGDVARRVRDWFTEKVRLSIPEPQASLGVSYVAGQRRALPESLSEEFRLLGLTHLVVASGFHLTIIVHFTRQLFGKLSKYLATASSFLMIAGFLLLTGFSTSMVRASLVAGLSLAAWYYGRTIHPVKLLFFVAAITILVNPSFIWGDVGWFLSFAAFGGVIILAPLLYDYFWGHGKKPNNLQNLILATTAAQITTFPIIAYAFGQYSPLALIANLFVLPFVPIAMLLTVFAGLMAIVLPSVAMVFGLPAYAFLYYMTSVTGRLAGTPLASGDVIFNMAAVAVSYILLLAGILYLWKQTGHSFRRDSIV